MVHPMKDEQETWIRLDVCQWT